MLFDFYKDGDISEPEMLTQMKVVTQALDELEFKNMLSGEEDQLNAVLTINAGAGGTESCENNIESNFLSFVPWQPCLAPI